MDVHRENTDVREVDFLPPEMAKTLIFVILISVMADCPHTIGVEFGTRSQTCKTFYGSKL